MDGKTSRSLVSLYVEKFKILESLHCNKVWPKLENKVFSLGSTKTLTVCQVKIRNLKDSYKKYEDENKQRGKQEHYRICYEEFDRVLEMS